MWLEWAQHTCGPGGERRNRGLVSWRSAHGKDPTAARKVLTKFSTKCANGIVTNESGYVCDTTRLLRQTKSCQNSFCTKFTNGIVTNESGYVCDTTRLLRVSIPLLHHPPPHHPALPPPPPPPRPLPQVDTHKNYTWRFVEMATFRYAVEISPGGKGWRKAVFLFTQCFMTSFAVVAVVAVVVNLVVAFVVNLVVAYMLL